MDMTKKVNKKAAMDLIATPVNPKREIGLTERQEQFARLYATGTVTQTEAARQAGYANPRQNATDIIQSPAVIERIRELKEELSIKFEVTFENHVKKLSEIRDAALDKGNFTAAVAAEKARGQAAGLYVSRQEIMVGKIDQMSREEVIAEIERMRKEYPMLANLTGSPVIDVEVVSGGRKEAEAENNKADNGSGDLEEHKESDREGGDMD
jgi:phage terminase small subunit